LLKPLLCFGESSKLRICCIINDRSGTATESPKQVVEKLFAKYAITPEILEIRDGNSITSLAKGAVQQNYNIIVAGGGDGTINAVASALVGNSAIKFGIIPMGTLNHFAGALGIPTDLEKAVEIIVAGHVRAVDVSEVNRQISVNNSSLGIYPAIVRLRENLQMSGHSKWPAAIWASLKIFTRFRRLRLELIPVTRPALNRDTSMLFVGNNTYDMSIPNLGTRSSLEGGQIWVMMPNASTRWNLLKTILTMLFGNEITSDVLTFGATELIVLSSSRFIKVAIDGEVIQLQPPLKYRTRPKSLQVIVPVTANPRE
jgi:diacylglycerol kinase family enzyme